MVRTPACHAGGHGFEPHSDRHIYALVAQSVEQGTENPRVGGSIPPQGTSPAGVAQLAEQLICNQQVVGSIPITSSTSGEIPEWPKGADCKSVVTDFDGSNPSLSTKALKPPFEAVFCCFFAFFHSYFHLICDIFCDKESIRLVSGFNNNDR